MQRGSVFQRYLNTLNLKDEAYLKKSTEIFRRLCMSVNGDIYSEELPIHKGPPLSADQIDIITLEWSRFHETQNICEKLGVDFFEISSAICFSLGKDPTLKGNKIGKIDVLKFLKYAEITPLFALKMLRALVDHQIKQLHEILAVVPCLPSEMIIAITMFRLYTTRNFSRDHEWDSLEILDRDENEFKRKFQESVKVFSEFKRLHREQLTLAATADQLQKVNFGDFAEEIGKLSTNREKRARIADKLEELRSFQKANNGHYKNHLAFLKNIEQKMPEVLKGRLSVVEMMESLSLQPIPKYGPEVSSYVSVDPVKPLSKLEDIKFAFRKVESYDERSQSDNQSTPDDKSKQKQARMTSRNSSADEEENTHRKVEQAELTEGKRPSSSKSRPQSAHSNDSKPSTSSEGVRKRTAHQPKKAKNEVQITYVSPLKNLRSSAQNNKVPAAASSTNQNPGPSRVSQVKVALQKTNPRNEVKRSPVKVVPHKTNPRNEIKRPPAQACQTPVKPKSQHPNLRQTILATPGRYDFDLEDDEPITDIAPPVKPPAQPIDQEARRRLASKRDEDVPPIPIKQARMQASSSNKVPFVKSPLPPIDPKANQHASSNQNEEISSIPAKKSAPILSKESSNDEEARRRLVSSDEDEPSIPAKQAKMQAGASIRKGGQHSTSAPKEAHKIVEKPAILKRPIPNASRKDPSHQSQSTSRSTQRIGTPSKHASAIKPQESAPTEQTVKQGNGDLTQDYSNLLDVPPATPKPVFVSRTSNPPQICLVGNDLAKIESECELQEDETSNISANGSSATSSFSTPQTNGHNQSKAAQKRPGPVIRNIKIEVMDVQDLARQSASNQNKTSSTNRETTGTVLQKIIKQEIMSPKRDQQTPHRNSKFEPRKEPATQTSNEVRFPSLTYESLSQRIQPGDEIFFKHDQNSPQYVKGVFKRHFYFNGTDQSVQVEFNGETIQVSAKQAAFAVPLEPQNWSILLKGVRVVVDCTQRFKDEKLPVFPIPFAGSIGSDNRSENGDFLVFLDEGFPYYAKSDSIRLIVQQPVSVDGQIDLDKAAKDYPETPNLYHMFVRPFLIKNRWRKLALTSYEIDSKHPFELKIREQINSTRCYTAILLLVQDELVLLRKPKNDKRMKDQNVIKKIAACRLLECNNPKCTHTDEWIHRSDITRFPHLDIVNNVHNE